MSFFNSTLTSGVQDISAVLPLLGTEQVQRHLGSALTGGFLYASACPITLFGSLGAVKIAFTIAIACTTIRRPNYSWIGAKWLADAGFSATGDVACLIGSPEAYLFGRDVLAKTKDRSSIYLAEEKLRDLIDQSHINNVEKLRVQLKPGLFWWNFGLVVSSVFFAGVGITPYIYLFQHSHRLPDGSPVWLYPMMRTVGTMLVVISSQFMIQLRLLQILRSHIIFLSLTNLHQSHGNTDTAHTSSNNTNAHDILNTITDKSKDITAEEWIWKLKQYISRPLPSDSNACQTLQEDLADQEKKHNVSPSTTTLLIILGFVILIGGISTVIGYIGSFTVVQNASNSLGPLIWLATEGGLSILRIFIWGFNPGFDDNDGFEFIVDTSPNNPLPTCINSKDEIERERLLPLKRSNTFLGEMASYLGPVESFAHDGVSVYYTLTGDIPPDTSKPINTDNVKRILYVTIHDYKEQASSVIVKIVDLDTSKWKYFKIQAALWDTLHVQMGVEVTAKDNILTRDTLFLLRLRDHCHDLSARLNRLRRGSPDSRLKKVAWPQTRGNVLSQFKRRVSGLLNKLNASFFLDRFRAQTPDVLPTQHGGTSWELPAIQPGAPVRRSSEPQYKLGSNWSLVLEGSETVENVEPDLGELTTKERRYLEHGSAERNARSFYQHSGWWNEAHMTLMRDELLQERPKGATPLLGDKLEINEIDHLLVTEGLAVESAIARQIARREQILYTDGQRMIQTVLEGRQLFMIGNVDEQHILEKELMLESSLNADSRWRVAKEASFSRLSQQRKSASERLELPDYRSSYEKIMADRWRTDSHEEKITKIWNAAESKRPGGDSQPIDLESELMDDSESAFQKRLDDAHNTNLGAQSTQESEFRLRNNANFSIAKRRCIERREAMQTRRLIERDDDFEIKKSQIFQQIKDLTEEKARERITAMVRIMCSKNTKYLDISNDLIEQAGSLDVLLDLIEYNEIITVITVSLTPFTFEMANKIASTATRMINVPHCDMFARGMKPIRRDLSSEDVTKRLNAGLPVFAYDSVQVSDYYRRGRPYLMFRHNNKSSCTMRFKATSDGPRKKVLLISHCGTRVDKGGLTRIRITVTRLGEETSTIPSDTCAENQSPIFSQIYSNNLDHNNFATQFVEIDNIGSGFHDLTIMLLDCHPIYWLDYATLANFDEAYQWREEYPQLLP